MATILKRDLVCIFGLGKSFANRDESTLEAGTEVTSRFDKDGWHKFTVKEYGRSVTYAVRDAATLDAALAEPEVEVEVEAKPTGFYATDPEVFYAAPSGRAWIVSSPDFDGIREIDAADIPADATPADSLLTPAECIDYCRQVEAESGESLVETA